MCPEAPAEPQPRAPAGSDGQQAGSGARGTSAAGGTGSPGWAFVPTEGARLLTHLATACHIHRQPAAVATPAPAERGARWGTATTLLYQGEVQTRALQQICCAGHPAPPTCSSSQLRSSPSTAKEELSCTTRSLSLPISLTSHRNSGWEATCGGMEQCVRRWKGAIVCTGKHALV